MFYLKSFDFDRIHSTVWPQNIFVNFRHRDFQSRTFKIKCYLSIELFIDVLNDFRAKLGDGLDLRKVGTLTGTNGR
jgi:hypothetical protein